MRIKSHTNRQTYVSTKYYFYLLNTYLNVVEQAEMSDEVYQRRERGNFSKTDEDNVRTLHQQGKTLEQIYDIMSNPQSNMHFSKGSKITKEIFNNKNKNTWKLPKIPQIKTQTVTTEKSNFQMVEEEKKEGAREPDLKEDLDAFQMPIKRFRDVFKRKYHYVLPLFIPSKLSTKIIEKKLQVNMNFKSFRKRSKEEFIMLTGRDDESFAVANSEGDVVESDDEKTFSIQLPEDARMDEEPNTGILGEKENSRYYISLNMKPLNILEKKTVKGESVFSRRNSPKTPSSKDKVTFSLSSVKKLMANIKTSSHTTK